MSPFTRKSNFYRQSLGRFFVVFAVLIAALSGFISVISSAVFAAAPQDTYSWVKNIGTSGCPRPLNPSFVAATADRYYVTDTAKGVDIFDTNGTFISRFGSFGTGNGQFGYGTLPIAIDSAGDVYVAESSNNRVQKFDADGNYILKFGSAGTGDGQFNGPVAISIGVNDDVYVLDRQNRRIEIFDSSGVYLSQIKLLSNGTGSSIIGNGMAISSSGDIYVEGGLTYPNVVVQRYASDGTFVSQWTGTYGTGVGQLPFFNGAGVTLDNMGHIYISDWEHGRIQKYTVSGTFVAQIGSSGTGDGQISNTGNFYGIILDPSGTLVVADAGNNRIQKFTTDGVYQSQFSYDTNNSNMLCSPAGLLRNSDGLTYVVDSSWNNVKIYDPQGRLVKTFGDGELVRPQGIAIDSAGDVYVVDGGNNTSRIEKFTSDGTYVSQFGSRGTGDGQLYDPQGIAIDSAGNIYVVDGSNARIQKFTPDGAYISQFGSYGTGDGQFSYPQGIAIDSAGDIYVVDSGNSRIEKFTPDGTYVSQFGSYGTGDGQFDWPAGISIDSSDNMYIDSDGYIKKFSSDGVYLSKFGQDVATNNQLGSYIYGSYIDSSGSIYVADSTHDRVSVWSMPIPPSTPQNLSQSSASATSAKLSWSKPSSVGSLAYTYNVQYRVKGTSTWVTATENLPSTMTLYTLEKLNPDTTYEARVLAVNSLGLSPAAVISFTTRQSVLAPDTGMAPAATNMNAYLYLVSIIIAIAAGGVSRGSRQPKT